jgi:hypothetical protein
MAMRKNSALKKEMDFHPVLVNTQERDIYQLYRWWVQPVGGGFGGSTMASGTVNMRFRCTP